MDEELLAEADKLNAQISGVAMEREALARIPTWPWDPTTLTAFITTLVAPAILWMITRLAQRLGL